MRVAGVFTSQLVSVLNVKASPSEASSGLKLGHVSTGTTPVEQSAGQAASPEVDEVIVSANVQPAQQPIESPVEVGVSSAPAKPVGESEPASQPTTNQPAQETSNPVEADASEKSPTPQVVAVSSNSATPVPVSTSTKQPFDSLTAGTKPQDDPSGSKLHDALVQRMDGLTRRFERVLNQLERRLNADEQSGDRFKNLLNAFVRQGGRLYHRVALIDLAAASRFSTQLSRLTLWASNFSRIERASAEFSRAYTAAFENSPSAFSIVA